MIRSSILALVVLAAGGPALARGGGTTPPGGQLAATAPGGTEGLAGPANVADAIRSGHAYRLPHGADAVRPRDPRARHRPSGY